MKLPMETLVNKLVSKYLQKIKNRGTLCRYKILLAEVMEC